LIRQKSKTDKSPKDVLIKKKNVFSSGQHPPRRLPKKQLSKPLPEKHKSVLPLPLDKSNPIPPGNSFLKKEIDSYELPSSYNTTSVTLMARDPYWLYAYWEIAPSSIEEMKKKTGQDFNKAVYVLRMYDITFKDFNGANANHWFDMDVGPLANNWYVNVWGENTSYCCDIGLRMAGGDFFTLARSNNVITPRRGLSGRKDMIWMERKSDPMEPPAPFVMGESKIQKSSGRGVQGAGFLAKSKGRPRTFARGRIPLSAEEVRSYYERLVPLFKRVVGRGSERKNGKNLFILERENARRVYSEEGVLLDEDWLGGLTWKEFYKKFILGSSEELAIQGGASQSLSQSRPQGISSAPEEKRRKFFFEIWTELIVYGRTEPDAEVHLADQRIPLRQDGTFSLRYALPDGKIPFPFVAVSSDKVDSRSISTSVERSQTLYAP